MLQNSSKIHGGTSNCSPECLEEEDLQKVVEQEPCDCITACSCFLFWSSILFLLFILFFSFSYSSCQKVTERERKKETLTAAFPAPTPQTAISPDKAESWKASVLFCQKHLKKTFGLLQNRAPFLKRSLC